MLSPVSQEAAPAPPGRRSVLATVENAFLALLFAALALIPMLEAGGRLLVGRGVPGADALVRHLTLFVAMFGGAVASRDGRLLTFASTDRILAGRWGGAARVVSGAVCGAVSIWLAWAAWDLVVAERTGGRPFAYGVPLWIVQLALPIGYALVAGRIVWHAGADWRGRLAAAVIVAALAAPGLCGILWGAGEDGERSASAVLLAAPAAKGVVIAGVLLLLAAAGVGAPLFAVLGGTALLLCWGSDPEEAIPISAASSETYSLVVEPFLPAIPLFTLAGYFLSESRASRRLVRVFQALFGWLRGGPAIVTAVVCAFFTSFTGASGVTILALGGLLLPVLVAERYRERDGLGLLTAAGSLGLLFPPSLAVILYGVVGGTPIDMLFLGGLVPGLLLVALTAGWGVLRSDCRPCHRPPFRLRKVWRAAWVAKWELALPVVVLVGIFGGFMTLVEASALTACCAFGIETFVYRDLGVRRDALRVMTACGVLVGGVLLILTAAKALTAYFVIAQVPNVALEWVREGVASRTVFLLLLNLFLLGVGCVMDIFSAIVVVVPLLKPLAAHFGLDPVHLGVLFLANLELGYLTPPVGMNLFLSSYRFGKPLTEVYRSVVPMLVVLLAGVLLITYLPWMTLWIPKLFGYAPGGPAPAF